MSDTSSDFCESRVQAALRERVKELTCLYGIAEASGRPDASLEEVLFEVSALLPPAWQYPETAAARIVLDGSACSAGGFPETPAATMSAALLVNGQPRGSVEVAYAQPCPAAHEGPFLREERDLLETIARHVSVVVERRLAQRDKLHLEEQLRHAERLATIGQLAAGVAHELNEPLGSILGFAQLILRNARLPEEVRPDAEKIVAGALHAREVIRKLMTFARQSPAAMERVDLSHLVEESLTLFEARAAGAGVTLERRLAGGLPALLADAAQIRQVVMNLVVNALQAMPGGGHLLVETFPRRGGAVLAVEDTGVGMTPEVCEKAFLPFFTTKDVNQGTGLGLSVVHGIVVSHSGDISVRSEPGRGARFEVQLPAAREI